MESLNKLSRTPPKVQARRKVILKALDVLEKISPNVSFSPISEKEYNLGVAMIVTNYPKDQINVIERKGVSIVNEFASVVFYPGLQIEAYAYFMAGGI